MISLTEDKISFMYPIRIPILIISLLLSALGLVAAPARPVKHTLTLPDGSSLTYRSVGDEHFHYFVTEDGRPLVAEGSTLYFAKSDPQGRMVSSGIPATDPAFRDDAAKAFLKQTDSGAVVAGAISSAVSRRLPELRPAVSRAPESMRTTAFPVTGSSRGLVILVEFSDVAFTLGDAREHYNAMLNKEGFDAFGGTGSARDYFIASSCGGFTPQFDVCGPVRLPKPQAHYGRNTPFEDAKAYQLPVHACDALKAEGFDFTPYDCDGDGKLDNVYVIYAGNGEASGKASDVDCVWPHSYEVQWGYDDDIKYGTMPEVKRNNYYDGLLLGHYACSNELEDVGIPDGIGTFCHEFSHVLGLPDLYYTGSGLSPVTPDSWSILDVGCYLNDSRTPPVYSSFERMSLGWMKPVVISEPGSYSLRPLTEENAAFLVPTETENEFFLFENRQQEGWDSYLAGKGMLVWHIDYDGDVWYENTVNNARMHQRVDLVEAVARTGFNSYARSSDPFPGASEVTEFSALTSPRFVSWAGIDPGFPLTDIREDGRDIRFTAGNPGDAAIAGVESDSPVGISGGDAVVISGSELPAEVYSLTGVRVYSGDSRRIELPSGLYIVKVGDRTVKVAVR